MSGSMAGAAAHRGESAKGRRIALFPGAFRPAHKVHLAAILELAARPDIDEVVVIVANRCRCIPGTTKALDADVAHRVLTLCLHGVAKVRLEIAPHNAVAHALAYLHRAAAGDTLLYCIGEADFDSGDDRFEDLLSVMARPGVAAEVLALPTGAGSIRATALRQALAAGDAQRDGFMAALPDHLSDEQRITVWSICRNGLRELNDIVEDKLRTLLDPALVGDAPKLCCVLPGKLDPVFRVQRADGTRLYVKYAGETAEAGCLGQPLQPKPRRRLSTERRAIKCLRTHLSGGIVELAEIAGFDKALSLLILSEVCPGGESLQGQLRAGRFDTRLAAQAGGFFAACHGMSAQVPALWGEADTDLRHWHAMLALRTVDIESALLWPRQRVDLQRLQQASSSVQRQGFFLLDAVPKNIRAGGGRIGVVDLELCSSRGDPAYDLGILLGHYLLWGLRTGAGTACLAAIRSALAAYRHGAGAAWAGMSGRVAAFAGAGLLHAVVSEQHFDVLQAFNPWLAAAAASLLAGGLDDTADIDHLLADATQATTAA